RPRPRWAPPRPAGRRCSGRPPPGGWARASGGAYARCPVLLALLYALLRLLIDLLIIRGRPAADRDLELLVLRHELLVLRRTARRPRWRRADRLILAALGRRLPSSALLLVRPATILGW